MMHGISVVVFYLLAFSSSFGIVVECQDWPNYDFVVCKA